MADIPAAIFTTDYSMLVGTTAVWIFTPGQLKFGVRWIRIINGSSYYSGSTSMNSFIWLSRTGQPAVIGGAGSFCLVPGQVEEFRAPGFVVLNPLSAIATAPNTPLTVEVG